MDYSQLTPRQAARVAEAIGEDPSAVPIQCEAPGCLSVAPLGNMYSMAIIYRMPGPGKAPYQCPNEQHYGCTHDHAVLAMLGCLRAHIASGDHA